MSADSTIVWFRNDLRLDDHPALRWAIARGGPVIPVFIWAPEEEDNWPPGAASRVWLHDSLQSLDAQLRKAGSRLVLRCGPTLESLIALVRETRATAVCWSRRYEPAVIVRDQSISQCLHDRGIEARSFNANLLFEPWTIKTKSERSYQVFTPFWSACLKSGDPAEPLAAPRRIPPPGKWPRSRTIEEFELEPSIDWAGGIRKSWTPGEIGAGRNMKEFLAGPLGTYDAARDLPNQQGTSRLSPHLHFGEISPRRIWHEILRTVAARGRANPSAGCFLRELGWREFAHHLLHHFPHTPEQPLRVQFADFPWRKDRKSLRAWQRGRTGYPIVDAGMRQLWSTGWMHNRVRMVAASFLVKHLLLPWQNGAKWFWDTLVDADLANNTLGWQWSAGCGADAAPYFRIFNPVTQGEKFDPDGTFVRRWLPELVALPDKFIHQPWNAPREVLRAAGVELGRTYPRPIVDQAAAHERALAALRTISRE